MRRVTGKRHQAGFSSGCSQGDFTDGWDQACWAQPLFSSPWLLTKCIQLVTRCFLPPYNPAQVAWGLRVKRGIILSLPKCCLSYTICFRGLPDNALLFWEPAPYTNCLPWWHWPLQEKLFFLSKKIQKRDWNTGRIQGLRKTKPFLWSFPRLICFKYWVTKSLFFFSLGALGWWKESKLVCEWYKNGSFLNLLRSLQNQSILGFVCSRDQNSRSDFL